jgi:alpha-glucosidase
MRKFIPLLLSCLLFWSCSDNNTWLVSSPDANLQVNIQLEEDGTLNYSASLLVDEEAVSALESSPLGLDREDAKFSSALKFVSASGPSLITDQYSLVTGKKKEIIYKANQFTLALESQEGQPLEIIFRVSNDGMAYRYYFPNESSEKHTIIKEYSAFNLPDEGKVWTLAYDTISDYAPAYETYFENTLDIGTPAPWNKNGWSFPSTFSTNGLWILITESNLDGSYPASHLEANCDDGIYKLRFPEQSECFGEFSNKPVSTLPWHSPWRLAIIGDNPGTILESTLVTDLADPSKIEDTSWIKPGRASWSWWSDSPSPRYVKEQNRFTDLAVEMGWEYNLMDANWNNMLDGKVEEAIDYANSKNIGAILWYNSGGAHNVVGEEPRDKMWDPEIREKEFQWMEDIGVKGIKVDFFQSDKQAIINQYLGILEDGAEHHVLLNFHGCTLPRGWRRTWPNMMTLESVAGAEVYKFGTKFAPLAPVLNTILPFTRNVAGAMDYTPVTFTDHTYPHLTTFAHELALSVVFESGILHMADKVEAYQSLPEYAKEFLRKVPTTWDDTKYIGGTPGDYVAIARKSGDVWYVAGISGSETARHLTITTDFLEEGSYTADLILDGDHDQEFLNQQLEIEAANQISMDVLPYGGFAGIIIKK